MNHVKTSGEDKNMYKIVVENQGLFQKYNQKHNDKI